MIHSRRGAEQQLLHSAWSSSPTEIFGGFETHTLCCDTSSICIHFLQDCMRGVLEEPECRLGQGMLLLRGCVCAAGERLILGWHF